MKTKEQILNEIQTAMTLNKDNVEKCNVALSDAQGFIMHEEKELQNRLDEEYRRGMNDAWEIAREVISMEDEKFDNIFDELLSPRYVITNNTPLQVQEKIIAYHKTKEKESNKVQVGDVVQDKNDGTKATILDCDAETTIEDERYWMVFTENGCVESWRENEFTKTGESVDVCGALIKQPS